MDELKDKWERFEKALASPPKEHVPEAVKARIYEKVRAEARASSRGFHARRPAIAFASILVVLACVTYIAFHLQSRMAPVGPRSNVPTPVVSGQVPHNITAVTDASSSDSSLEKLLGERFSLKDAEAVSGAIVLAAQKGASRSGLDSIVRDGLAKNRTPRELLAMVERASEFASSRNAAAVAAQKPDSAAAKVFEPSATGTRSESKSERLEGKSARKQERMENRLEKLDREREKRNTKRSGN